MAEKQSNGNDVGKGTPGPGRRKGVPNKLPAQLREMILGALDAAGGVEYLTERAKDPRTAAAFLTLLGKVLPMQVTGPGPGQDGGPLVVQFVRTIVDPRAETGAK